MLKPPSQQKQCIPNYMGMKSLVSGVCVSQGGLRTTNGINHLFQSSWHKGSLVSILLAPTGSPRRGHAARAGKQPFPLDGS